MRFQSADMNPVAKGCSGDLAQSRIPVNQTGTRNILRVPGHATVGCIWNFQIGGGSKWAIFQFSKLKFDMIPFFSLIHSPTVAKILSCKNGFLSLICIKLKRDTALKTISLDLPDNSTPL